MKKDTIYSIPRHRVGDFTFDESVVEVFPDMIGRSVPGYGSILAAIPQLVERFVTAGSNVYDLGCSLGAVTTAVHKHAPQNCVIHAVDNSPAMVNRFRQILDELKEDAVREDATVRVHLADVQDFAMKNSSLTVLNFTLQFIPADRRDSLLRTISQSLLPGGALLLSEKIRLEASGEQQVLTELHHEFKRANGYSDLEIAQKRTALENTLVPETIDTHLTRLRSVGFRVALTWFQCFNFASMLAIK